MSKRSTHAREHQTSESPPAGAPDKAPPTPRTIKDLVEQLAKEYPDVIRLPSDWQDHSPWQQIHDFHIPLLFQLSPTETNTLLYAVNRCQMNASRSWPIPQDQFVAETRYSLRPVQKATRKIDSLGLLIVDKGCGRGHIHRYTIPNDISAIPAPPYEQAAQAVAEEAAKRRRNKQGKDAATDTEANEKASQRRPLGKSAKTHEKASQRRPLDRKGVTETPEKASQRRPVVDPVVDQEGRKDDPNPSFLQLSEADFDLNQRMLSHDDIRKDGHPLPPPLLEKYAQLYEPPDLFPRLCEYLVNARAQNPGALKARLLESPEDFPPPTLDDLRHDPRYQPLDVLAFYEEFGPAFYAEPADAEESGAQIEGEQPAPERSDDPPAPEPPAPRQPIQRLPALPPPETPEIKQVPILQSISQIGELHQNTLTDAERTRLTIAERRIREISRANEAKGEPEPEAEPPGQEPDPPAASPQPNRGVITLFNLAAANLPAANAARIRQELDDEIAAIADDPEGEKQDRMNKAVGSYTEKIKAGQPGTAAGITTWSRPDDNRRQRLENIAGGRYGKRARKESRNGHHHISHSGRPEPVAGSPAGAS